MEKNSKRILVKVKPNARLSRIEKAAENNYLVWVKEKPVEDKANKAAIKILAGYFNISQSRINLLKGKASREKVFEILP